jgi:hypothetical protein
MAKPPSRHRELVVDFAGMLASLRRIGYGIDRIATRANVSRTSVRNYCVDTTPLHPHGERLIQLWCELSGSPREAVPMRPVYRSHHVRAEGRRDLGARAPSGAEIVRVGL